MVAFEKKLGMSQVHTDQEQIYPMKQSVWRYMSIAAAVLVFIMAGVYNYHNSSSSDGSYDMYYVKPMSEIQRSNKVIDTYTRGVIYYEKGQYDEALEQFILAARDEDTYQIQYWQAHTLYQQGDYNKASIAFANISKWPNASSAQSDDARWMYIISQLQSGQKVVALLKDLHYFADNSTSQYHNWALELLEKK